MLPRFSVVECASDAEAARDLDHYAVAHSERIRQWTFLRRLHGPCPDRGPGGIGCLKPLRHEGRHLGRRQGTLVSWRRTTDQEIRGGFET